MSQITAEGDVPVRAQYSFKEFETVLVGNMTSKGIESFANSDFYGGKKFRRNSNGRILINKIYFALNGIMYQRFTHMIETSKRTNKITCSEQRGLGFLILLLVRSQEYLSPQPAIMISATREVFGEKIFPILLKYLSAFLVLSCGLIFFILPTVFYKLKLYFVAVGYLLFYKNKHSKVRDIKIHRALI